MRPVAIALACAALIAACGEDGDGDGATGDTELARTFDVAGSPMYLECRGSGTPAVILEAGLGVAAAGTWTEVLDLEVGGARRGGRAETGEAGRSAGDTERGSGQGPVVSGW